MIKHIVLWKIKEENKEENAKEIKKRLEALVPKIDDIKKLEVGVNENGGEYDAALVSEFESYDDLKAYDGHPEHLKVRQFIRSIAVTRAAVDYEF